MPPEECLHAIFGRHCRPYEHLATIRRDADDMQPHRGIGTDVRGPQRHARGGLRTRQ